MKPHDIGRMIILAREARGLTQENLAKLIPKLPQSNLSRIEKGTLNVTDETLENIANTLNFPIDFFKQAYNLLDANPIYDRKRMTIPKKALYQLEAKMNIVCLTLDKLSTSVEIPDFGIPQAELNSELTPEGVASQIRYRLKVPSGPIIDLVGLLEENGVIVHFIDGVDLKFDGRIMVTQKAIPVLFVNSKLSNDRIRFTLAHELGHLVMHSNSIIDYSVEQVEQEANKFASEFLMPKHEIYRDLVNLKISNLGHLKSYWQVSKSALIYRAYSIQAIQQQTYQYLMIELGRMGERKQESGSVPLRGPRLISEIVNAYRDGFEYSMKEISNYVDLFESDFTELILGKPRLRIA